MHGRRHAFVRGGLVVVVALVLQVGLVADLRFWDVAGNLPLAVVVAAAVTGGSDRGATYGFAAGLSLDLVLGSPFGLYALALVLIGWLAGSASALLVHPPRWWAPLLAVAAGLLAAVVATATGHVVGVPYPAADIVRIGTVEGLIAAALVLPLSAVLRWAHGTEGRDELRVALR